MDPQMIALDLQAVALILFGPLLFWGLVLILVATLALVVILPFLSIRD
jgi:hypothetical protein